ncbi:MAG: DUF502 domain-containing protein [Acidiferrobacterales bacterium]|nr:DUF502 domain-containing protein [Acidiferrobacterales bacterium]
MNPKRTPHLRRYILTGIITVIPIWVTWLVFQFTFSQLSKLGLPGVQFLAGAVREDSPALAQLLLQQWFQSVLAVLLMLLGLYLLGFVATRVVGRRFLKLVDRLMERIPVAEKVYGATKTLLNVLQREPGKVQRVVLINFPSQHMKTVGLVTRVMKDKSSGRELAAVYVPTTPNPTSGYLEIVPIEDVVPTDMTVDEAMTLIISGGAVGPEMVSYEPPKSK